MPLTIGEANKIQRVLTALPRPADSKVATAARELADAARRKLGAGLNGEELAALWDEADTARADLAEQRAYDLIDQVVAAEPGRSEIHLLPADGDALTPCCGRTPFELPRDSRSTADQSLVTCTGRKPRPEPATNSPATTPQATTGHVTTWSEYRKNHPEYLASYGEANGYPPRCDGGDCGCVGIGFSAPSLRR